MRVVIDRFEGSYAVCEKEDGTVIEIELNKLPKGTKEGDILNIKDNKITIDISETKSRKEEISELTKDMWN